MATSARPSACAWASRSACSPRATSTSARRRRSRRAMAAEIHQLPSGSDRREEPADATPRAVSGSVYLDAYLAPFRKWLERDTVTEIIVNRPGEIWIEDADHPGMQRIKAPQIDDKLVQRLAEQVARVSHQGINREH